MNDTKNNTSLKQKLEENSDNLLALGTPCAVEGMRDDVYHSDPCITPSLSGTTAAKMVRPGGAELVHFEMTHPQTPTPAMIFGTVAHSLVLGAGAEIVVDKHVLASGRPSTRQDAKDWRAEQEALGHILVLPADYERAQAMAETIHAHPVAAPLLEGGKPEISIFGQDPETEIWLRGRIDYLRDNKTVIDYKTTISLDDGSFERKAWNFGYHIQAAHYLAIGKSLKIIRPDADYFLVAQEKNAPYRVQVFRISDTLLTLGKKAQRKAVRMWARCLKTGVWPGLPPTVAELDAPHWAQGSDEDAGETDFFDAEFQELIMKGQK